MGSIFENAMRGTQLVPKNAMTIFPKPTTDALQKFFRTKP